MACVGLVVAFLGLGERGFKTVELQLVGPGLVGCGLLLAGLRIFYFWLHNTEDEDDAEDLNIFAEPEVESFHDIAPRPVQVSCRPAVLPAWREDDATRQQLAAGTGGDGGSTKDLQAFQIFLNSQRLFPNK